MVDTFQNLNRTIYQDEIAQDFERTKAALPMTTNPTGIMHGDVIKWDVTGLSGSAKTRGRDGNLVRGQLPFSQVSTNLVTEYSEKFTINEPDAFVSNPQVRGVYSSKSIAQCNRAKDQLVVDTLDATSVVYNSGTAVTFSSLATCTGVLTTLWENDVPADDYKTWVLLTVKAAAQLMRIPEFKSRDYVDLMPAQNGLPARRYVRWLDANWMTFNGLTGRTGATAKCYVYHSDAIGHQTGGEPEGHAYYDEKEDRYEHWAKIKHAAATVLPRGVMRVLHDDTAALA